MHPAAAPPGRRNGWRRGEACVSPAQRSLLSNPYPRSPWIPRPFAAMGVPPSAPPHLRTSGAWNTADLLVAVVPAPPNTRASRATRQAVVRRRSEAAPSPPFPVGHNDWRARPESPARRPLDTPPIVWCGPHRLCEVCDRQRRPVRLRPRETAQGRAGAAHGARQAGSGAHERSAPAHRAPGRQAEPA